MPNEGCIPFIPFIPEPCPTASREGEDIPPPGGAGERMCAGRGEAVRKPGLALACGKGEAVPT